MGTTIVVGTRRQRFKAWIRSHKDEIVVVSVTGGLITAFIAGTIALIKADAEYRARTEAEFNARIDELNAFWEEAKLGQGYDMSERYPFAGEKSDL